jgi:hypothetical protein
MRKGYWSCTVLGLTMVLTVGCTSSRPMRGGGDTESRQNSLITTQFSDDFEDGDSTGWTVHDGNWSVVTDGTKAFQGNNASGYARASAGDPTWKDQVVEARFKPVSWGGTSNQDPFLV